MRVRNFRRICISALQKYYTYVTFRLAKSMAETHMRYYTMINHGIILRSKTI